MPGRSSGPGIWKAPRIRFVDGRVRLSRVPPFNRRTIVPVIAEWLLRKGPGVGNVTPERSLDFLSRSALTGRIASARRPLGDRLDFFGRIVPG
jgi:hypothetical protein